LFVKNDVITHIYSSIKFNGGLIMGNLLNKKDIAHIAKLAELEYSEEEIEKITGQLDKIIRHVAKIGEADTSDVMSSSRVSDLSNVFREDQVRSSLSREESLKNAPLEDNGGFKVPKID
jgi:aspartyl-tRNA(Asn)/glutamyl-tRNA(Gln) amidotransferase subunit C